MADRTLGKRLVRNKKARDHFEHLWRQAHRGEFAERCAYCGHPPFDHIAGSRRWRHDVPEAWRVKRVQSQYTALYSVALARELRTEQVVCFTIPDREEAA